MKFLFCINKNKHKREKKNNNNKTGRKQALFALRPNKFSTWVKNATAASFSAPGLKFFWRRSLFSNEYVWKSHEKPWLCDVRIAKFALRTVCFLWILSSWKPRANAQVKKKNVICKNHIAQNTIWIHFHFQCKMMEIYFLESVRAYERKDIYIKEKIQTPVAHTKQWIT